MKKIDLTATLATDTEGWSYLWIDGGAADEALAPYRLEDAMPEILEALTYEGAQPDDDLDPEYDDRGVSIWIVSPENLSHLRDRSAGDEAFTIWCDLDMTKDRLGNVQDHGTQYPDEEVQS